MRGLDLKAFPVLWMKGLSAITCSMEMELQQLRGQSTGVATDGGVLGCDVPRCLGWRAVVVVASLTGEEGGGGRGDGVVVRCCQGLISFHDSCIHIMKKTHTYIYI